MKFATAGSTDNIKIQHFPASQLGDETAILGGVRSGAIQLGALTSQTLSSVDPSFGVFSVPYLFPNTKAVTDYANSAAGQKLLDGLSKYGMHGLAFAISGFSGVISTEPIKSSSDLQGKKLRTLPSPIEQPTLKALGATPVSVGATQLYLALQQGTVDGVTSTPTFWLGNKLGEVAHNATFLNYECICDAFVVNQTYWDSLSASQQKALETAAKAGQKVSLDSNDRYASQAMSTLKSSGVTVYNSLSDLKAVKAKLQSEVWPQLGQLIGKDQITAAQKVTGAGSGG